MKFKKGDVVCGTKTRWDDIDWNMVNTKFKIVKVNSHDGIYEVIDMSKPSLHSLAYSQEFINNVFIKVDK